MNKKLIILLALLLSACSVKELAQYTVKKNNSCVYINSTTVAPQWVCGRFEVQIGLDATGIAEKSIGGITYMKNSAFINGEQELITKIKVYADNKVRKHLRKIVNNYLTDKAVNSIIDNISRDSLYVNGAHYSMLVKDIIGANGRVYAWVNINEVHLQKLLKRAILAAVADQPLLWHKIRMDKNYDKMAGEFSQ